MSTVLAVLAAVAVLMGLATAIIGLLNQRKIKNTAGKIQQITVSVDGQMSGLLMRVDQLVQSMQRQGAVVPAPPAPAAVAEAIQAKNGGQVPPAAADEKPAP